MSGAGDNETPLGQYLTQCLVADHDVGFDAERLDDRGHERRIIRRKDAEGIADDVIQTAGAMSKSRCHVSFSDPAC